MQFSKDTITLYAAEVSKLNICDYVYIHTSGYSNDWSASDGCKTDLLAVVPWNGGYGTIPSYNDTRIVNSEFFNNDTLNSVRNLQIRLTDESGVALPDFHTPYLLQIAIKFLE